MKRLLLYFFLIFLCTIFSACSFTKFTGETISKGVAPSGIIHLISGGYGQPQAVSEENAVRNAFKNILLNGIPNSNQESPMLGKKADEVFAKNQDFFDTFLESGKDRFILEKSTKGYCWQKPSTASSEVELKINLKSLRSYLENEGIIRSFGL